MARRRAKKTVKKVESSHVNDENDVVENEAQFDKEGMIFPCPFGCVLAGTS